MSGTVSVLRLRDVRICFPGAGLPAVDGVDLDVFEHETVVLAGESGSGKTLTALCAARLLPRNAAWSAREISLNNVPLLPLSERGIAAVRGKEIAYIFQEPTAYLDPLYTAGEQVAEVIMCHAGASRGQALLQARRLLELAGLSDAGRVMASYPHELSGGMNQRVFIAMALASRPKLLVADEPTTALDVTIEARVIDLVRSLKKELGFSLLFITHNLGIARSIADRIYVMHRGRIVEEGAVETIFTAARHEHTRNLIRAYESIGTMGA